MPVEHPCASVHVSSPCTAFVSSDAALDIHYVDAQGSLNLPRGDERVRFSVENERLIQDIGIAAKLIEPSFVFHHEDRRRSGPEIVWRERAANDWRHTQELEGAGSDEASRQCLAAVGTAVPLSRT